MQSYKIDRICPRCGSLDHPIALWESNVLKSFQEYLLRTCRSCILKGEKPSWIEQINTVKDVEKGKDNVSSI